MLIITVKTKQMIKKGIEKLFSQPISIIKNDLYSFLYSIFLAKELIINGTNIATKTEVEMDGRYLIIILHDCLFCLTFKKVGIKENWFASYIDSKFFESLFFCRR